MQSSYYNIFVSLLVIFMLKIDLRFCLLFFRVFFLCSTFIASYMVTRRLKLRAEQTD